MEGFENKEKEEIFSKAVRAGKRTYFFDVRATRGDDYYLTVTESKKRFKDDGKFVYEKHKLFLYKEDFEKFMDGLSQAMEFIKKERPFTPRTENRENDNFTDVDFDDLNK